MTRDWILRIKTILSFADCGLVEFLEVPSASIHGQFYIKHRESKNGPLVPLSLNGFEEVEASQKLDWLLFRLQFAIDIMKQAKNAPSVGGLPLDSGLKVTK